MDDAESCHIVTTDDATNHKEVSQCKINNQNDDAILAAEIHNDLDKCIAVMDANRKQSVDTAATTPYSSTTVYVTGMPLRYCTETVIEKMMTRYGKIVRCTVHTQQSNKFFAFCEFIESSSATEAIRGLNGRKLGGQHLLVRPAFKEGSSSSVPSSVVAVAKTAAAISSNESLNNPKRLRQQLDSKIEAIQRKLAKKDIR